MNRRLFAVPFALLCSGVIACSETRHASSPEDVAARQRAERADRRAEPSADRIDLDAEQRKQSVDARSDEQIEKIEANAEEQKDQIEKHADRSQFDAELKTRLEKVDARITDASNKAATAKPAERARANELLKSAKDQRAILGESYAKLSTVPQERWEPTKKQIETSIKTLEGQVDQLEEVLAT